MDIKSELNKLSEYQAQRQVIALQKQELLDGIEADRKSAIDKILTTEIRELISKVNAMADSEIAGVDLEFSDKLTALEPNVAALTNAIVDAVKAQGRTEKGDYLQAVYSSPRVTWDSKGLAGYAVAHPEVNAFKKIGEASVSFRDVKP